MIIEYSNEYKESYVTLLKLLWKDIRDKDIQEIITHHELNKDKIFLYLKEEKVIGFVNLSIRNDYVEGCTSNGVGYIEGIYVCKPYRRNKIGYELIDHAVAFFKSIGLTEVGSDTDVNNEMSKFFHKFIGFKEVATNVHYIMKIGD